MLDHPEIFLVENFWIRFPRLEHTFLYLIGCAHELGLRQHQRGVGQVGRNWAPVEDTLEYDFYSNHRELSSYSPKAFNRT